MRGSQKSLAPPFFSLSPLFRGAPVATTNRLASSLAGLFLRSKMLTDLPHRFSYLQYHRWCHGQFINPHIHKRFCKCRICAKFSTNTDPAAFLVAIVDHHPDHTQDSFVMRIVKIIQARILAVDCQRILRKIVCSY